MHIASSPMPSILGITREVLLSEGAAEAHLQPGVYVVDLELGTVSSQEAHPISRHVLPAELGGKLMASLTEVVARGRTHDRNESAWGARGSQMGARGRKHDDTVIASPSRDSLNAPCFEFLVDLLGPFIGPRLRFDRSRCLRTVDRSTALFMNKLMRTQSFLEVEEKKTALKLLRESYLKRVSGPKERRHSKIKT